MDQLPTRTRLIKANGLEFEVEVAGTGPRLALCLHGFPETAFSWRRQIPFLAELGYQVWAPNLRGYGHSSRPLRIRDYHIDHLVQDAAGLIEAAEVDSTLLIGHDWGGIIAWFTAMRRPDLVDRLIVMNAPHPAIMSRKIGTLPAQRKKSWYIFAFQIPWLPEWLLGRKNARMVAKAFRDMAVDKSAFPTEVLDVYRQNALLPGRLKAMLNYYRAALRYERDVKKKGFPLIQAPTLLIWGEEDQALDKALTYDTGRYAPDLAVHYLPGVSHWVQQEAPNEVNQILGQWLETIPGV